MYVCMYKKIYHKNLILHLQFKGNDTIKVAEMTDINVPKTVVKKIEGKTETLERHVPQMLLRGEQVAIIIKIN